MKKTYKGGHPAKTEFGNIMRDNGIRYYVLSLETNISESRIKQLARGVVPPTEDELTNIDDVMHTKYRLHVNPSSFTRFDAEAPVQKKSEKQIPIKGSHYRLVRKCVYRINQELIIGDSFAHCIGIYQRIYQSFNPEEPCPIIRSVEFIPGRLFDEELGAYEAVECELNMED